MQIPPRLPYAPTNIVTAIFTRDHVLTVREPDGPRTITVRFKAGDAILADEDQYGKDDDGNTVWLGVPVLIQEEGAEWPMLAYIKGPKDLFQFAPEGTEPDTYVFEYADASAPAATSSTSGKRSPWPWLIGIAGLSLLAYGLFNYAIKTETT